MDSRGIPIVVAAKYMSPKRPQSNTPVLNEPASSPYAIPTIKQEKSLLEAYDSFADAIFHSHYNRSMISDDLRYNIHDLFKSELYSQIDTPINSLPTSPKLVNNNILHTNNTTRKAPKFKLSKKTLFDFSEDKLSEKIKDDMADSQAIHETTNQEVEMTELNYNIDPVPENEESTVTESKHADLNNSTTLISHSNIPVMQHGATDLLENSKSQQQLQVDQKTTTVTDRDHETENTSVVTDEVVTLALEDTTTLSTPHVAKAIDVEARSDIKEIPTIVKEASDMVFESKSNKKTNLAVQHNKEIVFEDNCNENFANEKNNIKEIGLDKETPEKIAFQKKAEVFTGRRSSRRLRFIDASETTKKPNTTEKGKVAIEDEKVKKNLIEKAAIEEENAKDIPGASVKRVVSDNAIEDCTKSAIGTTCQTIEKDAKETVPSARKKAITITRRTTRSQRKDLIEPIDLCKRKKPNKSRAGTSKNPDASENSHKKQLQKAVPALPVEGPNDSYEPIVPPSKSVTEKSQLVVESVSEQPTKKHNESQTIETEKVDIVIKKASTRARKKETVQDAEPSKIPPIRRVLRKRKTSAGVDNDGPLCEEGAISIKITPNKRTRSTTTQLSGRRKTYALEADVRGNKSIRDVFSMKSGSLLSEIEPFENYPKSNDIEDCPQAAVEINNCETNQVEELAVCQEVDGDQETKDKQKTDEELETYERERRDMILAEIKTINERIPLLSESYELLDRAGRGTFSKVYKAKNLLANNEFDDEHVAIKMIFEISSPKRVCDEISCLAELRSSPCVTKLITAFRHEASTYLVLPYIKYDHFEEFYSDMAPDDVRSYISQLLTGLQSVHEKGIMHRDVKPGNFLYNKTTRVGYLADFGLAQVIDQSRPIRDLRKVSSSNAQYIQPEDQKGYYQNDSRCAINVNRSGTKGFRAPEVIVRFKYQTTAIDIWAVGVLLLIILSGHYPFFEPEDDSDSLLELAHLFGLNKTTEFANFYGRNFHTNIPSIPNNETDLYTLCKSLNKNKLEKWKDDDYRLAVDLMKKCLELIHTRRPTATEALNHPFFMTAKPVASS